MMEKEIRNLLATDIEVRSLEDNDTHVLEGYVNKYDQLSEYMGFYETVKRGAFNNSLNDDKNILALYNHDSSKVLGSTRSGSLKLSTDEVGLRFQLQPNMNVSYAKDVVELIRSKDISGMSFGFIVTDDIWEERDGEYYRSITDLELREITITPIPAYASSEVSCRSFDDFKDELNKEKAQTEQRELKQKQIKLELELLDM